MAEAKVKEQMTQSDSFLSYHLREVNLYGSKTNPILSCPEKSLVMIKME